MCMEIIHRFRTIYAVGTINRITDSVSVFACMKTDNWKIISSEGIHEKIDIIFIHFQIHG